MTNTNNTELNRPIVKFTFSYFIKLDNMLLLLLIVWLFVLVCGDNDDDDVVGWHLIDESQLRTSCFSPKHSCLWSKQCLRLYCLQSLVHCDHWDHWDHWIWDSPLFKNYI